jgi:hypothetical protein
MIKDDMRVNAEGYFDPTAYEAIKRVDKVCKEEERFHKLLTSIFTICDLAGFQIEGRIVLKDKKTGYIWR